MTGPRSPWLSRLVVSYAWLGCLLVLFGFVWAGFAPFDLNPPNRVAWTPTGLRFDRGIAYGTLSGPIAPLDDCSLEIWAVPSDGRRRGVIFGLHDERASWRFVVEQRRDELGLVWSEPSITTGTRTGQSLAPGEPVLITVTSDAAGARLYVDGSLRGTSGRFRLSGRECSGSFVMGSGPGDDATWRGSLLGLALYSRTLGPEEVSAGYRRWMSGAGPPAALADALSVLYRFDEGSGTLFYNRVTGRADGRIPASYTLPARTFLKRPSWSEVRLRGLDWADIAVNVGGFVPFGFFVFALARPSRSASLALGIAVAAGLLVSLSIESGQFWLPTRTSSLTDVITNVLGGLLGAGLCWGAGLADPHRTRI